MANQDDKGEAGKQDAPLKQDESKQPQLRPSNARTSGQKREKATENFSKSDSQKPADSSSSTGQRLAGQHALAMPWALLRRAAAAGWAWLKKRFVNAFHGVIEDLIKSALILGFVVLVGWLGWTWFTGPDLPPAYDEQASTNPDGPYHFMPMVDYARIGLGMEVNWDPPLQPDSTAIIYPEALSVQKIRGNILKLFKEKYPHCIQMGWSEVTVADGKTKVRDVVTLRLADLEGPEKREGDPRDFYLCELKHDAPRPTPEPEQSVESTKGDDTSEPE